VCPGGNGRRHELVCRQLPERHRLSAKGSRNVSLQRIGDKLRFPHNFELPPLLHPTTEAIAAVIVAMQDANWNFIIDQGATETFASDRTLHHRQLLSS